MVKNWHTKTRLSTSNTPFKHNVGISYSAYHPLRVTNPPLRSKQTCMCLLRLDNRLPPDSILRRDDSRRLRDVLSEDLVPKEPREPDEEFVADELLGRDLEDLCGMC